MSALEAIVRLFAPYVCLGCGTEADRLLCESCMQSLPPVPSRCYRCKAVTTDYMVCDACQGTARLRAVAAATHYREAARALVHRAKYERARSGLKELAAHMAPLLRALPADAVLVHVPTATSRVRQRGYDHALVLARELSRCSGLPRAACLRRVGQAHQVGANRAERLRQLRGAFRPVHPDLIRGRHIVLVDDVLTTGATLETAARELKRAGARSVSAVVFAQA